MKVSAIRGALAFAIPVLLVFAASAAHASATGQSQSYYFLAAGPLCGIIGGLAYGRRWGLPLILSISFGFTGVLLAVQQDTRSALFTDVVTVGLVFPFLFWCIAACEVLVLPAKLRVRGAMAFAIP